MPDACRVIPAIKSDWADQPGVKLRGDGLYGAYVSECMFASPLRHVDHVYCFNLWWEFFSVLQCFAGEVRPRLRLVSSSPCVRRLAYRHA